MQGNFTSEIMVRNRIRNLYIGKYIIVNTDIWSICTSSIIWDNVNVIIFGAVVKQ